MGTRIIPISIYSFPPLPILKLESYSHSHGTLMGIPFPPGIPLPWLSLICTSHISITVQLTVRALYSTNGVAVGCLGCPRCAPKFRQGEGCLFVCMQTRDKRRLFRNLCTLCPRATWLRHCVQSARMAGDAINSRRSTVDKSTYIQGASKK